jgi:hypothetical protein
MWPSEKYNKGSSGFVRAAVRIRLASMSIVVTRWSKDLLVLSLLLIMFVLLLMIIHRLGEIPQKIILPPIHITKMDAPTTKIYLDISILALSNMNGMGYIDHEIRDLPHPSTMINFPS